MAGEVDYCCAMVMILIGGYILFFLGSSAIYLLPVPSAWKPYLFYGILIVVGLVIVLALIGRAIEFVRRS